MNVRACACASACRESETDHCFTCFPARSFYVLIERSEVCSCTQRASLPLEACELCDVGRSFKTLVVSLAPHVCATVARAEGETSKSEPAPQLPMAQRWRSARPLSVARASCAARAHCAIDPASYARAKLIAACLASPFGLRRAA